MRETKARKDAVMSVAPTSTDRSAVTERSPRLSQTQAPPNATGKGGSVASYVREISPNPPSVAANEKRTNVQTPAKMKKSARTKVVVRACR
jgi:hypothetical protein